MMSMNRRKFCLLLIQCKLGETRELMREWGLLTMITSVSDEVPVTVDALLAEILAVVCEVENDGT